MSRTADAKLRSAVDEIESPAGFKLEDESKRHVGRRFPCIFRKAPERPRDIEQKPAGSYTEAKCGVGSVSVVGDVPRAKMHRVSIDEIRAKSRRRIIRGLGRD